MSAMVIDLDHLVADPIYDPDRCSIDSIYCIIYLMLIYVSFDSKQHTFIWNWFIHSPNFRFCDY